MENFTRTQQLLAPLKGSIIDKLPHSGTLPLPVSFFSLFYKVAGDGNAARHINFSNTTSDELEELTCAASKPAFFGDFKAGTIDPGSFCPIMDPFHTDLMKIVRDCLLDGTQISKNLKVELSKFHVYSRGSFVEPQVDPPRSEKMFGSLLIVFPTHHEGGDLLLRRRDHEWIFDSSQALSAECQPSIGYLVFPSDIEYKVAPVTSGHCITMTYKLYFDDGVPVSANDAVSEHLNPLQLTNKGVFHDVFTALLKNPEFLADGGTLAFGLRHIYPIEFKSYDRPLKRLYSLLKGSDAVVYQGARALGYEPILYVYYRLSSRSEGVMLDKDISGHEANDEADECNLIDIAQREGGILVIQEGEAFKRDPRHRPPERVEWVTPTTEDSRREVPYWDREKQRMYWGIGDICLVVRIGKAGDRLAYPTFADLNNTYESEEEEELEDWY